MIFVAVVEDEVPEQQRLRAFIADFSAQTGEAFTVSFFSSGAEFLSCADSFDLVLLDIVLGRESLSGIEVAREWRAKNPEAVLMFVTNMIQYALQSYAVDALNYIVKPVEYALFAQKMGRAVELLHLRRKKRLCVATQSGMECLCGEEIYFIETYGRSLKIHTAGGTVLCTDTMKNLEALLRQESFFRCHKSVLVNLLHVSRVHRDSVTVGGEEVPVSRHRKKDFMDALVNCFGGAIS